MRWQRWIIGLGLAGVLALMVGTAWAFFRPQSQLLGFRLQTVVQELQVSAVGENPPEESFASQADLSLVAELLPGAEPLIVPFWVRNVSTSAQVLELFGNILAGDQDWSLLAPAIELRITSDTGATPWHSLADWTSTENQLGTALPDSRLAAGEQRRYTLEFRLPLTNYTADTQGLSTGNFGFQIMGELWSEAQE